MLISCPACPKMYRVPASAIPPEGREVSCSACGTVWFEKGLEAEVVSVGAGAFTAAVSHTAHQHRPSRPAPAPEPASRDETEEESKVVALWSGERSAPRRHPSRPHAQRPQPEAPTARKSEPPKAAPRQAPTPEYDAPPQPDITSEASTRIAEDVAQYFSRDKWSFELPSFSALKTHFVSWRRDRRERSQNHGLDAALKFRDQIRARERNRLTPARRLGWCAWITALSALIVTVCDRDLMEDMWPQSAKAYALLFGAPASPVSFELKNITTRYAQSIEGPVIEIRGTVINQGTMPALPLLELSVDGHVLADYEAVSLSKVTVPARGERPFVVRAMVPEGTRRADIRLMAGAGDNLPGMQGFTLQRTGSGWGGATLPPLPLDALQTTR